jgi:hypothetical protein
VHRQLHSGVEAAERQLLYVCASAQATVQFHPGSWNPNRLTRMSTLKRGGRLRSSLVRMHSPMSVAMLQCSTVGVNITLHARHTAAEVMQR